MAREKNFCKDKALSQITQVFWQKGYNGASMDDLLNESGLSRSSLYATYGDKRSLFLQSLKAYADDQKENIVNGTCNCTTTAEVVNTLFSGIIENPNCNGVSKGCFLMNTIIELPGDADVNEIVSGNEILLVQQLIKFIKQDQQNKIIKQDQNPRLLANFIYNNFLGFQAMAKSGATKAKLNGIKNMVITCLK